MLDALLIFVDGHAGQGGLAAVANAGHAALISAPSSSVEVRVIPSDEKAVIAHHTHVAIHVQQAPAARE